MRKFSILIICLAYTISNAQKTRFFSGVTAYLNSNMYKKTYFKLSLGVDYKVTKFLKPEIEGNFYLGNLNEHEETNAQFQKISILQRNFRGYGLAFIPKICFGNGEDEIREGFLQILPRYSITKIEGKEVFNYLDNASELKTETEIVKEFRHSIGIGIGFYFDFSDRDSNALALNLYYDNIDFGNTLSNLKHSYRNYSTNQTIGAGVVYYFGFTNKN